MRRNRTRLPFAMFTCASLLRCAADSSAVFGPAGTERDGGADVSAADSSVAADAAHDRDAIADVYAADGGDALPDQIGADCIGLSFNNGLPGGCASPLICVYQGPDGGFRNRCTLACDPLGPDNGACSDAGALLTGSCVRGMAGDPNTPDNCALNEN